MYQVDFNSPKHVHFIGIGGISMSGLAEVLLKNGFLISGSDSQDSDILAHLRSLGASVVIGQAAANITEAIDCVVYTAAIHPDNPEFRAAEDSGIPMLSRAELLGQIMANYPVSIAVAGTHGKTTTTSMAAHVLLAAGEDPTVSVGGILPAIHGNIRIGSSDTFLTEACEYTNSYHSLRPACAVILNIDNDHLDFFRDLDDIADSFRTFAEKVPREGTVVINIDSPKTAELAGLLSCRVITVSAVKEADVTATDISFDEEGNGSFTAFFRGEELGRFTLKVPGMHNVSNALAVIALARSLDLDPEAIRRGLLSFGGTERRFQHKGAMGGTAVIDDYAHHPTEIRATLKTAKAIPHRELWVIFQPHTFSRTKLLLADFAAALSAADHVVLAKIYPAREPDIFGISSADLRDALQNIGTDAVYFPTFEEIEDYVRKNCTDGDLLITMGAGNVTNIGPALVD